jgi:hypothetical protein
MPPSETPPQRPVSLLEVISRFSLSFHRHQQCRQIIHRDRILRMRSPNRLPLHLQRRSIRQFRPPDPPGPLIQSRKIVQHESNLPMRLPKRTPVSPQRPTVNLLRLRKFLEPIQNRSQRNPVRSNGKGIPRPHAQPVHHRPPRKRLRSAKPPPRVLQSSKVVVQASQSVVPIAPRQTRVAISKRASIPLPRLPKFSKVFADHPKLIPQSQMVKGRFTARTSQQM